MVDTDMEDMEDTEDMGVVDMHLLDKVVGRIALWVDWAMTCAPEMAPLDLVSFLAERGRRGEALEDAVLQGDDFLGMEKGGSQRKTEERKERQKCPSR